MNEKSATKKKKNIVVLGGGFGGVYTALELEKQFKHQKDEYNVILVSRDNYFTYQPMLAEIVGGSLGVLDSVSALHNLLKHTQLYIREISEIDTVKQTITLSPNFNHTDLEIHYDYLVVALGNVTDFRNSPGGLHEHALPFKFLADAFKLRNRIIDVIETAALEVDPDVRKTLLTFVVGGGGFSGIEVVAEINDLARKLVKDYKTLTQDELRVVLIHSKERCVDREMPPKLGEYAGKLLQKRGVEIIYNKHLTSATPNEAILEDGVRIQTKTVVSTVPSNPNPLLDQLPFEKIKSRVAADKFLQVLGSKNIWAIGDCAASPSPTNEKFFCPPTAQFAVRQGKCVAKNIKAITKNKKPKKFAFKELGMMAALGHRRAIAQLFGFIRLSGFFAWVLWRVAYWSKLPGINRKFKVLISWILDTLVPQEPVQLKAEVRSGITHLHFAKNDVIFHKGDIGDFLYIIVDGTVEVVEKRGEKEVKIATLNKGEFFGEMALLNQKKRNATVKCRTDTELIAIRRADFKILVANFGDLREQFMKTEENRLKENNEIINKGGNIEHIGDLNHLPDEDFSPPRAENE